MSFAKLLCSRFDTAIVVALAAMFLVAQPSPAQTYTVLHSFTGGLDGERPTAGLTLLGTGNLFGAAGANSLFRMRQLGLGWVLTPIYEFDGTDGQFVAGRVTFGPGGTLYGASSGGGLLECMDGAGCGLIFSMRPPRSICSAVSCLWTESVLYQFDPLGHRGDGVVPTGGLIFDASGNIYGTTLLGGLFNEGTVFQLTPSQGGWTETVLHHFQQQQTDGALPNGHLIIDRAGNIVGTTSVGGANDCFGRGCGVVFELTHNGSGWTETILHTFSYGADGSEPSGGLIFDAAGNLYGLTAYGGPNNGGTLYQLTPSSGGYTFQVLYGFTGSQDYAGPSGILAVDNTGTLFGSTSGEGAFGHGSVFKLTPVQGGWTYTDLHDFAGGADGGVPEGGPALDPNGNLYGTTFYGGTGSCTSGCGVVWQIIP